LKAGHRRTGQCLFFQKSSPNRLNSHPEPEFIDEEFSRTRKISPAVPEYNLVENWKTESENNTNITFDDIKPL
jgi:hypothetical protein